MTNRRCSVLFSADTRRNVMENGTIGKQLSMSKLDDDDDDDDNDDNDDGDVQELTHFGSAGSAALSRKRRFAMF